MPVAFPRRGARDTAGASLDGLEGWANPSRRRGGRIEPTRQQDQTAREARADRRVVRLLPPCAALLLGFVEQRCPPIAPRSSVVHRWSSWFSPTLAPNRSLARHDRSRHAWRWCRATRRGHDARTGAVGGIRGLEKGTWARTPADLGRHTRAVHRLCDAARRVRFADACGVSCRVRAGSVTIALRATRDSPRDGGSPTRHKAGSA
jgi:hypothetical protein